MIDLSRISKQYGGDYLFRDLSLRIGDGERLAVVGANGTGKSTLMKIILGDVEPDSGEISRSRSHSAGYLPQDGIVHAGRTVAREAATAFDDLLELHERAEGIHREIDALAAAGGESSPVLLDLVEELGKIQHHLEHREGWSIESKVKEVLLGLGFRHRDLERPTDQFSGGWQMRLALGKLLLREPSILMLDEPTNHLDIESLQWVEDYLGGYEGSVVLISHDRRFLDNLAKRTVELSLGRLAEYRGNYSYFLKEKENRAAIQRARFANQQDKIKTTMQFVERFRAKNTKASQVQSRLRMLEKMEEVEVEGSESAITFDFPPPPKPGKVIAVLEGISKNYGADEVFSGLDLTVLRGDRVAFLGVNGAGKSTLARILAGVEGFQTGTRTIGHNVSISFFTQHQAESLDPSRTALQTLEDAAPAGMQGRLRTLLGCFLFRGDDVFKPVGVLSGGEKSRLALAKMLLSPSNFLILDEPTNHLDLRSKEVLRTALGRFTGASVLVSHDRDFLEPLVNKVVEFHDGGTRTFPGSLGDYFDRIRREREDGVCIDGGEARGGSTPAQVEKKRKRLEAERRQELSRILKPLRKALDGAEGKIALAEARKGKIESSLADRRTCRDGRLAAELSLEYSELTTELAYLYDEWARLQEKVEEAES